MLDRSPTLITVMNLIGKGMGKSWKRKKRKREKILLVEKSVTLCLLILYLCTPVEQMKASKGSFKAWVEKNVPKLQPDYNPNHGYEPYWPGGHWLYLDKELGPWVGKVCARTVDNKEYQQCVSIFGLCLGWWNDQFYRGFYTFDTYCKFLDAQCRTEYSKRSYFT
ncbi:unnamed protein product [Pieris brassicae]|uniref:Uncharacterized protein n=1 Tax=Pieris brassicae TaxID=7116 RepID=A0A9P0TUG8_PIEBR|nr:unnamed protein product [Pieris brassicae]